MDTPVHRPWSCDTFVARPGSQGPDTTVFGKNSDRPAREAQPLRRIPARSGGGRLQLAYVEIDDAAQTLAHIASSPYWCWGHEMGMNAAGVVIGNEALFTRQLAADVAAERAGQEVQPGILGMELLRLGLERGHTAERALEVMTQLLEAHGQWGAGTLSDDRAAAAYDNSFLIADAEQSWVLETVGRHWAARRVTEESWSLSNEPTIRGHWDRSSTDLHRHLQQQGWASSAEAVDFAEAVVDPMVPLQVSHIRLQRSRQLLTDTLKESGHLSFTDAERVLRDHYEGTFLQGPKFNAARPDFHTICMHKHPAGFTWGNTAASMIATLQAGSHPMFWWAAATPCTSVYIPVSATAAQLPSSVPLAGAAQLTGPNPERAQRDNYAEGSFWWQFQELLEAVAGDATGSQYNERQPIVRERFDALQQDWVHQAHELGQRGASQADWDAVTERCATDASQAARELTGRFTSG